jgi:hypothetical protein
VLPPGNVVSDGNLAITVKLNPTCTDYDSSPYSSNYSSGGVN